MRVDRARIGAILRLQRRAVDLEPGATYTEIGVRSFARGLFLKDPVTAETLGAKRVFHVQPGDLVVSNIFAWEGAVAVADERHLGTIGSHRFMTWTPRETNAVDVNYLAHYFASDEGLNALQNASPGSAGRNRTLSIANFEAIDVPLPSLPDQRRIAAHLNDVSVKANTAQRRAELLDAGIGDHTMPRLLDSLMTEARLPLVKVRELAHHVNDTIHPGESTGNAHVFVGLEHIRPHLGLLTGDRPVGDETGRKFRFRPGDVTYGYLRPYQNKVWAADRDGLCSVEQFVMRPHTGVVPSLLSAALRTNTVLAAVNEATNSLQLPRLRLNTLLDLDVPDIRAADDALLHRVTSLTEKTVLIGGLRQRRSTAIAALLPAARNEVFSALR